MHELNNPGAAASRAAVAASRKSARLHELSAKFSKTSMSNEQKQCLFQLQEQVLNVKRPVMMNSLEQSDAEDAFGRVDGVGTYHNAWKLRPRWSQSESIQASWSAHGVI